MATLEISSSAFEHGEQIPRRHTCEGEDVSPPLAWSGVPEETKSLVLIVVDLDAPGGPFAHWLAWGLEPDSGGLGEGERAPQEGQNDFGRQGYGGPCPPPRHRLHRYFFRLRAIDCVLDLPPDSIRLELREAMEGHMLAEAELVGTYKR